ncbi:MAG: thioredoxin family protein [Bacteroidia bacterium]
MTPFDISQAFGQAVSYEQYFSLVEEVVAKGETTGPVQSEALAHYTMLNLRRMKRTEKTVTLSEEIQQAVASITRPQTWVVLTEGWCGDAAPFNPIINKVASLNPNITLGFLLRDENLEVMDRYLTNGGRSIPKLVMFDEDGKELGTWGPRPQALADFRNKWLADPEVSPERVKELIQKWYAKDKGRSTQEELLALIEN